MLGHVFPLGYDFTYWMLETTQSDAWRYLPLLRGCNNSGIRATEILEKVSLDHGHKDRSRYLLRHLGSNDAAGRFWNWTDLLPHDYVDINTEAIYGEKSAFSEDGERLAERSQHRPLDNEIAKKNCREYRRLGDAAFALQENLYKPLLQNLATERIDIFAYVRRPAFERHGGRPPRTSPFFYESTLRGRDGSYQTLKDALEKQYRYYFHVNERLRTTNFASDFYFRLESKPYEGDDVLLPLKVQSVQRSL